jgi:hypothetical protein
MPLPILPAKKGDCPLNELFGVHGSDGACQIIIVKRPRNAAS